eukprot:gene5699-6283_t
MRTLRAVRELSRDGGKEDLFAALMRYCALQSISSEAQQFCYNIASAKGEIERLMRLGAEDKRICHKVHSINSDFCKEVRHPVTSHPKRGLIYI